MRAPHELLHDFYAAVNRGDIDAAVRDFDADIVRTEVVGRPRAVTLTGIDAVRAHVRAGRAGWAEGQCEPERVLERGERVVVHCHVRVRLHGATMWIDGRFADGFVVRDGRIVEFHTFAERAEAHAWAGITRHGG